MRITRNRLLRCALAFSLISVIPALADLEAGKRAYEQRDYRTALKELKLLASLLVPQVPAEVQASTVRAIGRTGDPRAPEIFLEHWSSHSPALAPRSWPPIDSSFSSRAPDHGRQTGPTI